MSIASKSHLRILEASLRRAAEKADELQSLLSAGNGKTVVYRNGLWISAQAWTPGFGAMLEKLMREKLGLHEVQVLPHKDQFGDVDGRRVIGRVY